MLKRGSLVLLIALLLDILTVSYGQDTGLYIPRDIRAAYDRGTRSYDGYPGQNYFQNQVDYEITAQIDPQSRRLTGYEKITFHNNSPYNLKDIGLRFYQNIFIKGGIRGRKSQSGRSDQRRGITFTHYQSCKTGYQSIVGDHF